MRANVGSGEALPLPTNAVWWERGAQLDPRRDEQNHAWEVVAMTYPKPTVRTVTGNGTFVLGRGSSANIRLQDASVSRHHARLTFGGPTVVVEDLESANGTRIVTASEEAGHTAIQDTALIPNQPVPVPENATLHLGSIVVLVRRALRPQEGGTAGLVVQSAAMQEVVAMVERIASSSLHVILIGPAGVGRDTLARLLHERSQRFRGPFVASQAAGRMSAVMERELLGIERDELRGAMPPKAGLLEAARGGTLLLDAASELSPPLRSELLRALSARTVTRLGARKPTPIDVRLVLGMSQEDSFTRSVCQLGGVTLAVPALRERPEDIAPLAEVFVARAASALSRPPPPISSEAQQLLRDYSFPQNARELAEIMSRAVPLAGSGSILPEHLLMILEGNVGEQADESEITQMRAVPKLPFP